jgi:hypothetical protein
VGTENIVMTDDRAAAVVDRRTTGQRHRRRAALVAIAMIASSAVVAVPVGDLSALMNGPQAALDVVGQAGSTYTVRVRIWDVDERTSSKLIRLEDYRLVDGAPPIAWTPATGSVPCDLFDGVLKCTVDPGQHVDGTLQITIRKPPPIEVWMWVDNIEWTLGVKLGTNKNQSHFTRAPRSDVRYPPSAEDPPQVEVGAWGVPAAAVAAGTFFEIGFRVGAQRMTTQDGRFKEFFDDRPMSVRIEVDGGLGDFERADATLYNGVYHEVSGARSWPSCDWHYIWASVSDRGWYYGRCDFKFFSAYNFVDFGVKVKSRGGSGNIHVLVNDRELLTVAVPQEPHAAGVLTSSATEVVEMQPVESTAPPQPSPADLPEDFEPPVPPVESPVSVPETAPPSTEPPESGPQPDTASESFELVTGAWT